MRFALIYLLPLIGGIAMAANAVAFAVLATGLDWPDAYGFTCRGLACLPAFAWHSPVLLRHGHPGEVLLFVTLYLWVLLPGAYGWWVRPFTLALSAERDDPKFRRKR